MMRWLQRASGPAYRQAIADERNNGRLPLAVLTVGHIEGHGWGFVAPWAQLALFPEKGTPVSFNHPGQRHEPFLLLRLWPMRSHARRHPRHEYEIEGRYWHGLAWRRSWGWRPRYAVLDPDVFDDPMQSEGWDGW